MAWLHSLILYLHILVPYLHSGCLSYAVGKTAPAAPGYTAAQLRGFLVHTCPRQGFPVHTAESTCHNHRGLPSKSLWSETRGATSMRSPSTTAREKLTQQRRPSRAINKETTNFKSLFTWNPREGLVSPSGMANLSGWPIRGRK